MLVRGWQAIRKMLHALPSHQHAREPLRLADQVLQKCAALLYGYCGVWDLFVLRSQKVTSATIDWWFQSFNQHGFQDVDEVGWVDLTWHRTQLG